MPDDYERFLRASRDHLPRRIWRVCRLTQDDYLLGLVDQRQEAMAAARTWYSDQSDTNK